LNFSESTSIPVNPRTNRPVGYAFVDLKSADEAEKAIENLSGKDILERKVSVQLARKPEPAGTKAEGETAEGAGAERKRSSGRGRGGRGRGRGGFRGRGGKAGAEGGADTATTGDEPLPLTDVTNDANAETTQAAMVPTEDDKPRAPRQPKQRGPPEDGIPSTTKVMVANLPYDLSEEKVREICFEHLSHLLIVMIAQGALRRLRAYLCQDRPSPNPSLHGQEASSSQRASQGPWFRIRHPFIRGAATEGCQRDERQGNRGP